MPADTDPEAPWEPCEAYPQLAALAAGMRPDWSPAELDDAVTAARQAGWSWTSVFREVARLVLAEDETPVTLRNSARRPVAGTPTGPEVNARGREAVMAAIEEGRARRTGPQPRLDEPPGAA